MGFLEPDLTRAGQTRIPTHNTLWADTRDNTRAKFTVFKVDIAQNPGAWPLGGVWCYLDVHPSRLNYMMNRRVTFDMGAWEQNTPLTTLLPYVIQAFPAVVVASKSDRWLLQVQSAGYMCFDHGFVEVMGTHLADGDHLILPALDTPIKDMTSLSNVDFSKCFVEVDVVEMSMSGKEQRHSQIRPVS